MSGLAVLLVLAVASTAVIILVSVRQVAAARKEAFAAERDASAAVTAANDAEADVDRLRRALDAVPLGVVVWDEDGDEVFRNVLARDFEDARHADAIAAQVIDQLLRAALEGRPSRRDLDLYGPPRRVLTVSAVPLADGVLGATAVVDDVSERRRLEAVRRDFVANMSHEIKTPIGALGVLAETIVAEEDQAVVRRLAERMTGEAIRVGRIIDDLLALSRIEAEEQPMREPVRLAEVVDEAVDRIRSLADARHIAIETDGLGEPHRVRGDRRQLVSAVANLLENACKYSDDGSSVRVSSRSEGSWIEISVTDRGIGIPSRDLERVFERFYRVDRARSRETGGTGLGLSIVRHIVSSHGGEVRVSSQEGVGSTFTLQLPAVQGGVARSGVEPRQEASPA